MFTAAFPRIIHATTPRKPPYVLKSDDTRALRAAHTRQAKPTHTRTHLEIPVNHFFLVAVIKRLRHVQHVARPLLLAEGPPAQVLVQLSPRGEL